MSRSCFVPACVLSAILLSPAMALAEEPAATVPSTESSSSPKPVGKEEAAEAKPSAPKPVIDEASKRDAAQRYRRAIELFEEGNLQLALIEFRRAYDVVSDYRVLYNIALVLDRLGQYAESVRNYEQYLREGAGAVPEARRTEVEQSLSVLRQRTAKLSVVVNESGAEVVLDSKPLGRSPVADVVVDAGSHSLTVTKPGFLTASRAIELAGGDERRVAIGLTLAPKVAQEKGIPTLAWVGWGLAGGGAIGTAVCALAWSSSASSLDGLKSRQTTSDDLRSEASKVNTFTALTFIAGGVTVASASAALYLTLKHGATEPEPRKQAWWVAPTGLGAAAGGTF